MKPIPSHDQKFIDKVSPFFFLVEKYFRYSVTGLNHIPKTGPALLVMNHGILPFHGFLLAKKIIERIGLYPRSLGADFLFHLPGVREFFLQGGAVKANPKNAERLLKQGHLVLLAPGGIYEALLAKPGLKRIPWERRLGFVKTAIKTGAPILPSYCPGINNAYFNSYLFLRQRIKIMEKVRFSLPIFFGLGLLPLPARLHHRVGKPISVKKIRGENLDQQVQRIHGEVMAAMQHMVLRMH